MNYNSQYEETIDLKDLCISILRKWYWILIAAVILAAALGAYKAMEAPQPALSSSEIETNHETIEENETSIKECQDVIALQQQNIANWETLLETYEGILSEAEQELNVVTLSEDRISLLSQITSLNSQITSTENQIASAKQQIEKNETVIAELEKENADLLAEENEMISVSRSSILKYGILGGFLGAFLVCAVLLVQYLFSKHMHSPDELKERYDLHILGELHHTNSQKGGAISRLLDRWAGYGKPKDISKEYNLIATGIEISSHTGNVLITGTVSAETLEQVYENLKQRLPLEKYTLCIGENPVYNEDSMRKLADSSVVLVESLATSNKKEIQKLAELFSVSKADVIGAVIM